jgi:hypothetical protein
MEFSLVALGNNVVYSNILKANSSVAFHMWISVIVLPDLLNLP